MLVESAVPPSETVRLSDISATVVQPGAGGKQAGSFFSYRHTDQGTKRPRKPHSAILVHVKNGVGRV